jgi:ABC-2 type transport system ATP-binding protein
MIDVQGLTKFYGHVPGIQDVSFGIESGEIVGFLGPNGAGKSTTMRILTCYMPATSGTATVSGFDVFQSPLEVRRRIGYLPENVPLYPELTVRDYLNFVGELKGMPRKERRHQMDRIMPMVGAKEVADRIIGNLSKGYRQRVGLAQALLNDPEVLILDEPTVGLDPRQIIEIRDLIRDLAGSRTIILCTHILPEVSMTCSRVIIINKGRIVTQDTPQNLTRQLQQQSTVMLEVDGPQLEVLTKLEAVPGVVSVQPKENGAPAAGISQFHVESRPDVDIRRELAAAVCGNGWGLLTLRPVSLSLEDIFVQLGTEEEG